MPAKRILPFMDDLLINPKFKGQRNYIHGTDICMEVLKYLGPINDFAITLRRQTNKAVRLVNKEIVSIPAQDCVGKITANDIGINGERANREFLLVESNILANGRVTYDETIIMHESRLSDLGSSMSFYKPKNYHIIEAIISNNKHLVNSKVQNQGWLFAKMALIHWPVLEESYFELSLERTLGKSLAITGIYQDDDKIGELTFTKEGSK